MTTIDPVTCAWFMTDMYEIAQNRFFWNDNDYDCIAGPSPAKHPLIAYSLRLSKEGKVVLAMNGKDRT